MSAISPNTGLADSALLRMDGVERVCGIADGIDSGAGDVSSCFQTRFCCRTFRQSCLSMQSSTTSASAVFVGNEHRRGRAGRRHACGEYSHACSSRPHSCWVVPWIENPRVGGSIPPQATIHRFALVTRRPSELKSPQQVDCSGPFSFRTRPQSSPPGWPSAGVEAKLAKTPAPPAATHRRMLQMFHPPARMG
jgi:hypothetical protein